MQKGFTLLELSVVILIIGLIATAVISGTTFNSRAEMQKIAREVTYYLAAIDQFKDQYDYLPGDFPNAWVIFQGFGCANGSQAECNGNGNGNIEIGIPASEPNEDAVGWQHLSFAGLIEGDYSFVSGLVVPGENMPAGPRNDVGYWLNSRTLTVGTARNLVGVTYYNSGAFSPVEAYYIEQKIDNGSPGTGQMIVRRDQDRAFVNTICISEDFNSANFANAEFLFTDEGRDSCALLFRL